MGYKETKINFYPDRITYVGDKLEGVDTSFITDDPDYDAVCEDQELIIMMSWEAPIMERSATFICENGGDILEIGFGMGIASDYIQSHNPNSHIIIELHPELAEKAREWAVDKPSVTIVEGDWIEEIAALGQFDGIFFDTYGAFGHWGSFASSVAGNAKEGCHITFWNPTVKETGEWCGFGNSHDISYEHIAVEPPPRVYYGGPVYVMPKVVM